MTKETAKDIAIALVAKSGKAFDMCALDDCDTISENEKIKILNEVQNYCDLLIDKIEKKYDIKVQPTSAGIVNAIVFE